MAKLTIKQQKMLPQMEQKRNNQKRPNYVQNRVNNCYFIAAFIDKLLIYKNLKTSKLRPKYC